MFFARIDFSRQILTTQVDPRAEGLKPDKIHNKPIFFWKGLERYLD